MGLGERMSTCAEIRVLNIYQIFPRGNVFAGNFFFLLFPFFLSGETVNSEFPMLDVSDVSTPKMGESFVSQKHLQSS